MPITLRLALRDWDYMTPLVLGDVTSPKLDIEVDRVGTLIPHVGKSAAYDAAEVSFSRYTQLCFEGDKSIVGIPNFIMRGFRHRCIITTKDSPVRKLADLAGKRIGVTGWRDSGNTWTRAALRREGVGVEDAMWYAGRLTAAHPITDRLDGFARPGRIEGAPGEKPMVDMLVDGELDAIFTPFMPDGFFSEGSSFRQVLADFRSAERHYFDEVGYVPGMHLIGIKADIVAEHPWIIPELSNLIDESQRVWLNKRRKYAETTPWMFDELLRCSSDLPAGWNASGFAENYAMIKGFIDELYTQGILPQRLLPEVLFPLDTDGSDTSIAIAKMKMKIKGNEHVA
ncbi:ABC transporter substrate-binding protein [Phyllobacterium sp. 22552]|uniref:ABC transporter substrate-binding protein n=1 Tax=Phyllobacterium sp. 22552 TaxID=3453941 RepID=UPI003F826635